MCINCGGETESTEWGAWCHACGGVAHRKGELFFRLVAVVYGPGGRFPIVYDRSTSDYAYMFKDRWIGPSNQEVLDLFRDAMKWVPADQQPRYIAAAEAIIAAMKGTPDLDGYRRPHTRVAHGSLDAVIALSYHDVKGHGTDSDLRIAITPTTTKEEALIIGIAQ